jgi:uncharacterized protein
LYHHQYLKTNSLRILKKKMLYRQYLRNAMLLLCGLLGWHIGLAQSKLPEPMSPPRLFNDFANIVATPQAQQLEKMLRDYRDSTTNEISIVVVPTLNDMDISDFTTELSLKWKVGKKGRNNGVVLVVAMQEKKTRIATGEGLNGSMTDIMCKRILDNYLKPNFITGNYYQGFVATVGAIQKVAAGTFRDEAFDKRGGRKASDGGANVFIIILVLVIAFIIISRLMRNAVPSASYGSRGRRYYNSGGGFGGGWIIGGGGFGGGGNNNSGNGMSDFGGFGGGDFDGGGASGDW